MNLIRCLHVSDSSEAVSQMKSVGVDETGIKLMERKMLHLNLRVEGIAPRIANILKQEMLSIGGDAAVDMQGFDCSVDRVNTILMGSRKQIEKLALKLDQ